MTNNLSYTELNLENYIQLNELLEVLHGSLSNDAWLRRNSASMLTECLHSESPHRVLGVFNEENKLIAFGVLYDGARGKENIKSYFTDDEETLDSAINLKLIGCHPEFRQKGLADRVLIELESVAVTKGKKEILATIHPENIPSIKLFLRSGYELQGSSETSYGSRNIYSKLLTA